MKKKKLILILGVVLFFGGVSCHQKSPVALDEAHLKNSNIGNNLPLVEVVVPVKRQFEAQVTIEGMAKPNRVANLHALETGYLDSVKKEIGEEVEINEPLVTLKNPGIWRSYKKSIANLKAKKAVYKRLKEVHIKTPSLIPVNDVEVAKTDYEREKVEYNAIRERIYYLTVRAPFAGIITNRFVDKGMLVESGVSGNGSPIVELMDLTKIRLEIFVSEQDLEAIKVGAKVRVEFPELKNQIIDAAISRYSGALNHQGDKMKVEIDIPNPNLKIKAGMKALVHFNLKKEVNVKSINKEAVLVQKGNNFVYLVNNGLVEKRFIEIGLRNQNFVEILNEDIGNNNQIIINGKNLVKHGVKVRTVKK